MSRLVVHMHVACLPVLRSMTHPHSGSLSIEDTAAQADPNATHMAAYPRQSSSCRDSSAALTHWHALLDDERRDALCALLWLRLSVHDHRVGDGAIGAPARMAGLQVIRTVAQQTSRTVRCAEMSPVLQQRVPCRASRCHHERALCVPELVAIEDEGVPVAIRPHAQADHVAAGARLRHAQRADMLACQRRCPPKTPCRPHSMHMRAGTTNFQHCR